MRHGKPTQEGASDLSERDVRILQAVIQDYIACPEPVGSRALARSHELDVSAATVRNAMGDLEELGYLTKPHSSAGRVPTAKAYRFYVSRLLEVRPLRQRERARVQRGYEPPADDVGTLMHQTGRLLHQLTHHAAVVAAPRLDHTPLRHVSFVRLRENRVLAVLVSRAGVVQNRVIPVDFPVTQDELDRMTRYLEAFLTRAGGSLHDLRARLRAAMEEDRVTYDALAARALELGRRAIEGGPEGGSAEGEVVVEGETSFLDAPEFADRGRMRALLGALGQKETLLKLLERAEGPGIRIFIGSESDLGRDDDVAVVLASYRQGEETLGTLGVIGPTRMDYARVVPFVEYTAGVLGRLLEGERH